MPCQRAQQSPEPTRPGFRHGCALALYLARYSRRWAFTLPILAVGALVSGSRSGLLTFAISLLLATLLGRRASRRFVSAILVTAAALYAANRLGYATPLERLLDGNSSVRVSDTARSARAAGHT